MKALAGHWLLGRDHLDAYIEAAKTFEVDAVAYEAFLDRRSRRRESEAGGDRFIRDGSTAHIVIVGVLTDEPDFFFDMFGGGNTVFGDIVAALEAAEADSEITEIVLEIDSPGGDVAGFFRTAQAIAATSKPTTAEVTNMAASAAFGLAVQADKVIAENRMVMLGSVGVATTVFVSDLRIQIASTEAPNKRPDAQTDEGVAIIRAELDAIHAEFAAIIASGRGVSVVEVNADFGRGGLVIAADALQAGMIDAVSDAPTAAGSADDSKRMESARMDLQELKTQHPELYAQAVAQGVDDGVKRERDRVTAHVEAGKAVGKPEIACEFIANGDDFTSQTVQAKYMTAGITKIEGDNRAADAADTAGVTGASSGTPGDPSNVDADAQTNALFDAVEAHLDIDTRAEA